MLASALTMSTKDCLILGGVSGCDGAPTYVKGLTPSGSAKGGPSVGVTEVGSERARAESSWETGAGWLARTETDADS
jgi:hypothetical protein